MVTVPVTGPALQPSPVNLVRSADDPLRNGDETAGNWVRGFAYLPETSAAAGLIGPCTAVNLNSIPANAQLVTWRPYLVWTGIQCSEFGWEEFDWIGRAERLLDVATPTAIEKELWGGALAQADGLPNLYLAASPAPSGGPTALNQVVDLTPSGGPVSIKRAFFALEEALASSGLGGRGMIHAQPQATPNFTGVRREGNLLLTQNDTIVVPGNGYPGTGPNGQQPAAGNTWLYATGLVQVRIDTTGADNGIILVPDPREYIPEGGGAGSGDPSWMAGAMNRDTGLVTVRAERFAVASWDGQQHFAIEAVLDTTQ